MLLTGFPEPAAGYPDQALLEKWDQLLKVRSEVNRALEQPGGKDVIGNALEAQVTIGAADDLLDRLKTQQAELLTLTMVSQLDIQPGPLTGLKARNCLD